MADPDDIDKLLAEIDAMNKRPASVPARTSASQPPAPTNTTGSSAGARTQWTAISAGGAGVLGLVTGTVLGFLPYVGALPTGLGAAFGGAVVAFVSGPPNWFKRGS